MFIKVVKDGYITMIGRAITGTKITEQEYLEILAVIHSRPAAREGYGYRLKTDLTWEEYAMPPVEPEPPTEEEALTRYANELTGADDPNLISATETLIQQRMEEK